MRIASRASAMPRRLVAKPGASRTTTTSLPRRPPTARRLLPRRRSRSGSPPARPPARCRYPSCPRRSPRPSGPRERSASRPVALLLRDRGQLATRLPALLNAQHVVLVARDDERVRAGSERRQRALHHPLGAVLGRAVLRGIAADLRMESEEDGAVPQDGLATRDGRAQSALFPDLDRATL